MKPSKRQATKQLAAVQDLIYKLAWDASGTYKLPFDECLREGYWQFMKAWNYYDPDKGVKFSSFYTSIYKWQVVSRIKEKAKRQARLPQIEFKENLRGVLRLVEQPPALRAPSLEVVEGLSPDARRIVRLLVKTPPQLLENVRTPQRLLARVKTFLLRECGFTRPRFNRAQEEIRTAFREVWNPPPPPPPPPPCLTPVEFRSLFVRDVVGFAPTDNTSI